MLHALILYHRKRARGQVEPMRTPSGNGRHLRTADGWSRRQADMPGLRKFAARSGPCPMLYYPSVVGQDYVIALLGL